MGRRKGTVVLSKVRAAPGTGPRRGRRAGWVALTGTPGTGKSSVARLLPDRYDVVELRTLARTLGAAHRAGRGSVTVDLRHFAREFRQRMRARPRGVLVGHLSHFAPVAYVIVLRCHPKELDRRLRRTRRTARDRRANVLSEILDVVLVEALTTGLPVREVDTTGRSVEHVAREVAAIVGRRPAPRFGRTRWLSDRTVTEELLRHRL